MIRGAAWVVGLALGAFVLARLFGVGAIFSGFLALQYGQILYRVRYKRLGRLLPGIGRIDYVVGTAIFAFLFVVGFLIGSPFTIFAMIAWGLGWAIWGLFLATRLPTIRAGSDEPFTRETIWGD